MASQLLVGGPLASQIHSHYCPWTDEAFGILLHNRHVTTLVVVLLMWVTLRPSLSPYSSNPNQHQQQSKQTFLFLFFCGYSNSKTEHRTQLHHADDVGACTLNYVTSVVQGQVYVPPGERCPAVRPRRFAPGLLVPGGDGHALPVHRVPSHGEFTRTAVHFTCT